MITIILIYAGLVILVCGLVVIGQTIPILPGGFFTVATGHGGRDILFLLLWIPVVTFIAVNRLEKGVTFGKGRIRLRNPLMVFAGLVGMYALSMLLLSVVLNPSGPSAAVWDLNLSSSRLLQVNWMSLHLLPFSVAIGLVVSYVFFRIFAGNSSLRGTVGYMLVISIVAALEFVVHLMEINVALAAFIAMLFVGFMPEIGLSIRQFLLREQELSGL